jgi:SAM-dependent methyltransferase
MELGFSGEVADFYHRYRHGYPAAVLDVLGDAFGLTGQDVLVDLGCGTGQLTLPMAARVRAVVGMDPEPDMLQRARQAAYERDVRNVTWLIGADSDIPVLRGLLGNNSVAAVTIGQALHWMNRQELFSAIIPLVRAGGGVAVVTNGTPLWLQDTGWSRALRDYLEHWLGTKLRFACGTDEQSQRRYHDDLASAGFDVLTSAADYTAELDLDQLVGGIYSALAVAQLPAPDQRPAFAEQIRRAVAPHEHFSEHVHVAILAGRIR